LRVVGGGEVAVVEALKKVRDLGSHLIPSPCEKAKLAAAHRRASSEDLF